MKTKDDYLREISSYAQELDYTSSKRDYLIRVMGVVDDEVYEFVSSLIKLAKADGWVEGQSDLHV